MVSASACNSKSVIEGLVPDYKSVILPQPVLISSTGNYILSAISSSCYISFTITKYKFPINSGTFSANDSLVVIQQAVPRTAYSSTRNNCIAAYNLGDNIDVSSYNSTNNYIAAFTSKPPYTSYTSLTSYGGQNNIEYKTNQDSFMGFKYNDGNKVYYGWILLKMTNVGVFIKGYAYQTFDPIKAGG